MVLTGRTTLSAIRPPYGYRTEFVQQFLFLLRICWSPLLVSTAVLSYGAPALQTGGFVEPCGSLDRLGGFFILAVIHEQ